jgi:putative hydrolase of HD superfamily
MENRLEKQMAFALETDKCKQIFRQTYISDASRKENDAEHGFSLALMCSLLAEYAEEPIDKLRTMEMVLIHDLVEIDAGDTYAYDEAAHLDKRQREEKAAHRIFGMLPEDQCVYYRKLWEEFEAYETPEAKFAHTLDNAQPMMLNDATDGLAWREHEVRSEQIYKRNKRTREGSGTIWSFLQNIIKRNIQKGNIRD